MWNKKKAITRSNSSDALTFLSTTNRFHSCEAGSFCVDIGKLCIEAGKLEVVAVSPPFPPSWPTAAPFGNSNSHSPPSLPLLEAHRRLRPPLVRTSPCGLIVHGRASAKRHFSPVSQRGAPTRSPRSSAFARATLTSATTFSATAFMLPNGWPCKARTNASSLLPLYKERHATGL